MSPDVLSSASGIRKTSEWNQRSRASDRCQTFPKRACSFSHTDRRSCIMGCDSERSTCMIGQQPAPHEQQPSNLTLDLGFNTLLGIVRDALDIPPTEYVPAVLGRPLLNLFFWRPTVIMQRPDHYGSYTSFPREAWFFLNGIMTNDAVAQVNAAYLAYLFHRPLTLIQNSTCGTLVDLIECALGKQWHRTTESAIQALPPIYDALKSEKERVILIAHSQGTIIAAMVLSLLYTLTRPKEAGPGGEALLGEISPAQPYAPPEVVYPDASRFQLDDFEPLTEDELAKLEVYCFANCANVMPYERPPTYDRSPIPWIESFGNVHDIVARLGMLAPRAAQWGIAIDGPRYAYRNGWGHLLNEHYLLAIEQAQKEGRKRGGRGGRAPYELVNADAFPDTMVPRLFSYLNGGAPDTR